MSGGILKGAGSRYARALATGLVGGLLFTSFDAGEVFAKPAAPETAASDDGCSTRTEEKSIVVESGKAPFGNSGVATVTDRHGKDLEPIANISEYEPDLAETSAQRLEQALVPTLADPPAGEQLGVTPVASGTPEAPTADDVCIEAESEGLETHELQVATDAAPSALHHAASFNGVTPGVTMRADVLGKWSNPIEPEVGGDTLTYQLENFPTVAVGFSGDVVTSIRVELAAPAAPKRLIAKLGLSDFRPSVANDEFGCPTSTSFPERGVTLHQRSDAAAAMATDGPSTANAPQGEGVYEIVVRSVDAASFVRRAQRCSQTEYAHRMDDLKMALDLDPTNVEVMCRLSEVHLATGACVAAEQLAAKAVNVDPGSDPCRLQWAKCLHQLARYDRAVEETRVVLEGTTAAPIVRAAALEEMALLAALGSKDVQQRAVPLHNKAIELADTLATSDDTAVRAAANDVLLSAHLAVAEQIAAGDWQSKDEAVGQWVSRASALAEQMIVSGDGDVSLRLRVAVTALTAGGRLHPPVDPKLWIEEAEQAAADYEATIGDDAFARSLMNWQLGMAYFHAAEIQHRRGEADLAIRYGEMADATLSPLAEERCDVPDTRYALGRLYFQIGAVHAVHQQDHDMACQWYDRAADLLMEPAPVTRLANPGHHGDALVSMGVSYWETGQRERAYELTAAGTALVDQGVAEGLLAAETLAVPKGNLNAMAKALGKAELTTPEQDSGGNVQVAHKPRAGNKRSAKSRSQTRTAGRTSSSAASRR